MSQRDVKNRIASVKNIEKITRAMQMVAAARLRRAEQRIEHLRPYADAIRRMTRQAAQAAGNIPSVPILKEHDQVGSVGLLLVTGDRGLAGAFNSQIIRAGVRSARAQESEGHETVWFASGRRGVSSLNFRGYDLQGSYVGFTDRPAYANAREIAADVMACYVDQKVDRVDIVYNHYVSALTQRVTHETLLPLQQASVIGEEGEEADDRGRGAQRARRDAGAGRVRARP